jgi:acyl-CoA dehydrogenase
MNFDDSPEDAAFRAEWQRWLTANAVSRRDPSRGFGALLAQGVDDPGLLDRARDWQARLADAGWGAIHWPVEHGGRAATPMQSLIFSEELAPFEVPLDIYGIGLGMIGPTLITWGTDEQKTRFLPALLDGSEIWCQLWSEPSAGSDVASLRTRAIWDAARDRWIVNGQKVWTSGAQFSRWGLAIVRTDPDAPKHKGISAFVIDMHAPGIDIRPLREMSGGTTFNEVFFTDVELRADRLVGPLNQGWNVALTTLAHERFTAGLMGMTAMTAEPVLRLARATRRDGGAPAADDPVLRQRLADVWTRHRLLGLTISRALTAAQANGMPGPEGSTLKLAWSDLATAEAGLALDILGAAGSLTGAAAPADGEWATAFAFAPSYHIAGGTDEVQRTIIGEHVLGLPRHPDERKPSAAATTRA